MTPEERLEAVEELIAERDEINEKLLELMGGAVEQAEEEEEEFSTPTKQARKCGNCQQPGHIARNCSTPASNINKHEKPRQPCGECGSIGSRHFKTCSKSGAKSSASPEKDDDEGDDGAGAVMGPQTYNNVKMLKTRGKHSKEISEQLDLSIREVNAAMSSSDYTHYLDIRESQ